MTPSPRRAELAFAAVYGGLFMSLGGHIAFFTIWLEDWGLAAAEIGWVHAVAVATRIVTGIGVPALADRLGRPRAAMVSVALAGAVAGGLLALAGSRVEIYLLAIILAVAYAALIPMSDAHGFASAERLGFSYRRARSVGSFTFLAATFLCGVSVEAFGVDAALWWLTAPLLLAALGAAFAPLGDGASPRKTAASERGWMTTPAFLLFLLAAAANQSSHGVYNVYGSLHWRGLGYSDSVIGALWSWAVLVEIGVFAVGASVMARLGPLGAMAVAAGVSLLRWTAMSLDPPFSVVIALQALHGITFGLAHLAALAYLQRAAPASRVATAQGLLSASAGGVGMLIATLAAAQAYPEFGGGAYLVGSAFALIGFCAVLTLRRLARRGERAHAASAAQPQSAGSGGNIIEPL